MPKIRKASRTSNIGLSGAVLVRHERHYYVHSSTFCALKQSHSFFKRITKTSGRKSLDHLQTKRLKQMIANFGAKLKIKSNTKYFSLSMIEFFTFAKAALSTDMDDVRDLFAPFGHQMNETIFDPTYFRAIYDLDFDEMTWRDESDCADTEVDQQEQQQLNSSSNSSTITKQTLDNNQTIGTEILSNTNTTATNDESNLVNQNSTSSIVESCNEDLPLVTTTYDDEDENAYMSDVDSEEETQSLLKSQAQFSEFILKASEQPRRPEFNMALFPNSSKIFENIDLCVNCFWNSPHERHQNILI
ncbi:hypothetical protein C9374_013306 [Naegleria lovaniensis]|uniref:Uncharacterized protein n=1 Tax=Naegleria lovaniensis TaxID=51637 RepID=A0AA88KPT3_NAELO|nr:uncharacterized protein C9374_013306 [Naegleria lovaniensis]KAG2391821.1 hypothetical protein C9374_013306 [Naegleria lovaniensis]